MKEIPLSKTGKNRGKYFALVDDEDYDWLMQWNWWAQKTPKTFYAVRNTPRFKDGTQKKIKMHKFILNAMDKDEIVDHKDHNGLNNQRNNIRKCSIRENNKNAVSQKGSTSKYLGVSLSQVRHYSYWAAHIRTPKKQICIGHFKNEEDAARAYDIKAKEIHGEFANLNFK